MLVFTPGDEPFDARDAWRRLRAEAASLAAPGPDACTTLLIDAGELESAVTDSLFAEVDGVDPLVDQLRDVTRRAAHLFLASIDGSAGLQARVAAIGAAIDRVHTERLPRLARRRVSEGFAFYGLHPAAYIAAARNFAVAANPHAAVCIGLRSIGTSLAAVVAATLRDRGVPVSTFSVRPRGHPFDRHLVIDEPLAAALARQVPGTHYLVVDEGPGLSGSSFASAAQMLSALGIDEAHVALFPSWNPDGSAFRSGEARRVWQRHRRWVAATDVGPRAVDGDDGVDLSGGAWRGRLYEDESQWPAVQPQFERVKRLMPQRREIVRFAGLGRYGAAALDRARALAAAGLGVEPVAFAGGYLRLPFVEGRPCTRADATPELLARAARHIGFLARTQRVEGRCSPEALQHMIETNVREADDSLRVPPLGEHATALANAPPAAIDGRMLPHEWIRTSDGYIKTDALDHASDHFYPGPQDAAWDLAAIEVEFMLAPGAMDMLLARYASESGDRDVRARLPFFRLAYAAFQLGYATMAHQSLGDSSDGRRFERRAGAFLDRLRARLSR